MRSRVLIILAGFILVCLFLATRKKTQAPVSGDRELSDVVAPGMIRSNHSESRAEANMRSGARRHVEGVSGVELSNALTERMDNDWRRPIEFYGMAVDEASNALAGVRIRFRWVDETETIEGHTAESLSDGEGRFSLNGKFGHSLHVWVSKEGYYASRGGEASFLYSLGNNLYSPEPNNPVVFRLRKRGEGAALATSANGMWDVLSIPVPKNGIPVRVDFSRKKADINGELEISESKTASEDGINCLVKMTLMDGGFIETNDEFRFEAPARGYTPQVSYNLSKNATNWVSHLSKNFYIVFGEPRRYGWLGIETDLSQETVFIRFAYNPTGSRNLEPLRQESGQSSKPKGNKSASVFE